MMYISLFDDTLKCKHHFLLHYPTVIENSGPVKYLWSMRFESKNKEYKNYTDSTSSRKNISLSVAKKSALKFSYFIVKNKLLINEQNHIMKKITKIDDDFKLYIENYMKVNQISAMLYIEYNGTIYKKNYFIFYNNNLYQIIYILQNNITQDIFLFLLKKKSKFNSHYNCYFFEQTDEKEYIIILIQKAGKPFVLNTLLNGEKIFKLKNI